jgi:cellulose synthase/poly-beta-1,6-N-acetylglucosamine synthase-like glycosyltransferase
LIAELLGFILLIISLSLFAYGIRSLVFVIVAERAIYKNGLSFYPHSTNTISKYNNNKCYFHNKSRFVGTELRNSVVESLNQPNVNNMTLRKHYNTRDFPFISIIVPAHNESLVIDRLMKSCANLTYERDRFQIIIVDDCSTDCTFEAIKPWTCHISNLKVARRYERKGWKGGALNFALTCLNEKSEYVLVVDADNTLITDILERFVSQFMNSYLYGDSIEAVQGYLIPTIYNGNNYNHMKETNWVSRGIDSRLALRDLIEFIAKDRMNLPIQITGSLFMIKSKVITSIGFSNDLAEDWDLTLDLHLAHRSTRQSHKKGQKLISFDLSLISYSEVTTRFTSYFRQRARVSEGHTRGLKKNLLKLLSSELPRLHKIEILFTGLHYVKFIFLVALILFDI